MAIITISRGSYSRGKQVAEKVAQTLGYACISRDILLDASETFNTNELKLARAIHDAPNLLDRFSNGKERYIAYIEAALLDFCREDNLVYHGLAGHFFVRQISHALKVRITADMQTRIRAEMEANKVSEREALKLLKEDDDQRRRWSRWLYGIDTADPNLYDLVIHLERLTPDEAADIICATVRSGRFAATDQSQRDLNDLALAARVRATLVERFPDIMVKAESGAVRIRIKSSAISMSSAPVEAEIQETAAQVKGVTRVEVQLKPIMMFDD
ncbi:MAG: cytidylate kinase-like family protein [Desulfobacteraceae bacterium]|nr:cytidylate kinase-like family protein [Desulfobacteraceae bacterium]